MSTFRFHLDNDAHARCVGRFLARDYRGCIDEWRALLGKGLPFELYQLALISHQRLFGTEAPLVAEVGQICLERWGERPDLAALIGVTLGQESAERAWQLAPCVGQYSAVMFYAAARFATARRAHDAYDAYLEACESQGECLEQHLAWAEGRLLEAGEFDDPRQEEEVTAELDEIRQHLAAADPPPQSSRAAETLRSRSIRLKSGGWFGRPVTMEFLRVREGEYRMGAPPAVGRWTDIPSHLVRITRPFWLARTPVTVAQWHAVTDGRHDASAADRPINKISWSDCEQWLQAARSRGLPLRLPTEAEWEYACRARSAGLYFWGDAPGPAADHAWTLENTPFENTAPEPLRSQGVVIYREDIELPEVGRKRPNPWGFHDMSGLIWEFCRDWFSEGPYAPEPPDDPVGPRDGTRRVARGGSFSDPARVAACSVRGAYPPDMRLPELGFRCVLDDG